MKQNISIVGGDLRIVNLAKILAKDGYTINTYGLENSIELNNLENIRINANLEETIKESEIIISSIPLSKNDDEIYSPFSNKKIKLEELIIKIKGKKLIAGGIKNETKEKIEKNNIEVIDLLKYEELTILNTISTAEGALQIAMEETKKTIYNSNVLILGFGRVGKTTANLFKSIGANVYCEARKKEDLAWIKVYRYNAVALEEIDKIINKFDIIINTIPSLIIDKKRLELINKKCIIIDLASAPGGVDFEEAKKQNINSILALALPGKVAPETSAEFIYEILYSILKTEEKI